MSDNNQSENRFNGTLDQYDGKSKTSKRELLATFLSLRDVAIVLAGLVGLVWFGIIDIPFINRFNELPYKNVVSTIIVSILVTYGIVWYRFKKFIDKIYSKEWVHIMLTDMFGSGAGHFKTDPDTFRNDGIVEFVESEYDDEKGEWIETKKEKDNPQINVQRQGYDVPNRRYNLVRLVDIRKNPDGEKKIVFEDVDDYPAEIQDDMVIANKDHLRYEIQQMHEDAEFGRKAHMTLKSRLKSYLNKLSSQLAIMHQHAVDEGVDSPEKLYEQSIEGYDAVEIDVDDMSPDQSYTEALGEQGAKQILENVNKSSSGNNQGDSNE